MTITQKEFYKHLSKIQFCSLYRTSESKTVIRNNSRMLLLLPMSIQAWPAWLSITSATSDVSSPL